MKKNLPSFILFIMEPIEELNETTWQGPFSEDVQNRAMENLEKGKILYFPKLSFPLQAEEYPFLSPEKVDPKRKNISYDQEKGRLGGSLWEEERAKLLKQMLKRYALTCREFLELLLPYYTSCIVQGRTSFRPVEIDGRKMSARKDDRRLHVDAFPSNPTKGKRILRIFTNIDPEGGKRVWNVGEPFEKVVKKFIPKIPKPIPALFHLMKLCKMTKQTRTAYDHYMLHMHNKMKEDLAYQSSVSKKKAEFPAGSSWIVFTDQVSHAALRGKHVLEQTFYLPVTGLKDPSTAPLKVLEKFLYQTLA